MPKRATQQEQAALIEMFRNARDQLLDTIINYHGVGTKVYANTILQQAEKTLKRLEKSSAYYAKSVIPKEYQKALDEIYAYFKNNRLRMKHPEAFAHIHNDAIYAVAREMQFQIGQGLEQVGRQISRYVTAARDDTLRQVGLQATGEKIASGSTVQQMQQNLIAKLRDEGFMAVQYGEGKQAYQVSLDSYAGMVARSTTREAGNIARENQLVENGYDLVQFTEHYPTCALCAQFQGRVFSISGKDKRFPPLSKAFASGYRNIHPNCRHVLVAWLEEFQTPEEVEEAIRKSNLPFEDPRNKEEIDLYNQQQSENRQLRQDLYQYERYKARLGEDAPKSFASFRKLKYNNKDEFKQLVQSYKIKNQQIWEKQILDEASQIADFKAFTAPTEIPEWANNQINFWSDPEKDALNYYTSHEFTSINEYLRGKATASDDIKSKIDHISNAINNSDVEENIVLWRGASMSNFTQAEWLKNTPLEKWAGIIIDDKAFSSTSVLQTGAFEDREVFMQILVPAGRKGAYINPISEFENLEYEMLLQKGAEFQILQVQERGGKKFLQVLLL